LAEDSLSAFGPRRGTPRRGCSEELSAEALRKRMGRAEVEAGKRDGLPIDERDKPKRLRAEVFELPRANPILKEASVSVARELDPNPRREPVHLSGKRSAPHGHRERHERTRPRRRKTLTEPSGPGSPQLSRPTALGRQCDTAAATGRLAIGTARRLGQLLTGPARSCTTREFLRLLTTAVRTTLLIAGAGFEPATFGL
jgi:hypothetical protein